MTPDTADAPLVVEEFSAEQLHEAVQACRGRAWPAAPDAVMDDGLRARIVIAWLRTHGVHARPVSAPSSTPAPAHAAAAAPAPRARARRWPALPEFDRKRLAGGDRDDD